MGALVHGSRCLFETTVAVTHSAPSLRFYQTLAELGCDLALPHREAVERRLRIEGPHETLDAYGGLALLAQLNVAAESADTRGPSAVFGEFNGYSFAHHWTRGTRRDRRRSLVQVFAGCLLSRCIELETCTVGFAVSLEREAAPSPPLTWGNGFVVVNCSKRTFSGLDDLDADAFRRGLRERAHRTLNLLRRRRLSPDCPNQVLFSSVGNLEYVGAAPSLDPSQLVMVPTPTREDSANVVVWSNNGIHGLTVVAKKQHFLMTAARPAWLSLFHEVD